MFFQRLKQLKGLFIKSYTIFKCDKISVKYYA